MDLADLPLVVKPMHVAHIPPVMEIERESFSLPWPERAYWHELTQNEFAHYYVLTPRFASPSPRTEASWGQRLRKTFQRRPSLDPDLVIGYGGFWLMYDEAHISTLAVGAVFRRQGLGELLLVALLDEALRWSASRATLEVRVSNAAAQALYIKYGFEQAGRRKAYYNDNQEDALILTTPEFSAPTYRDLLDNRRRQIVERLSRISLDKIL